MRLLFLGSQNPAVQDLQDLLIAQGFQIQADGHFGLKTLAALKAFQARAGLSVDGIAGPATLEALRSQPEAGKPVGWLDFVALFPQVMPQTYSLLDGQTPEKPKGIRLLDRCIGNKTINCTQFTTWFCATAYGRTWTSDAWARWQNTGRQKKTGQIPDYGPRVCLDWGVGTTAPGPGPYLVQYFTQRGGHSLIVVDHDLETDKILTLEANAAYDLNGVGWAEIGNLRDVPHPGANWADKVKQTWASRIDSKKGVHVARLRVTENSVKDWLNKGQK